MKPLCTFFVVSLIVFSFAFGSLAQSQAQSPGLGSISGQVTSNGKPFPGIEVHLWNDGKTRLKVMTDESGKYKFADLIPGNYGVAPDTKEKEYVVPLDNHYVDCQKSARVTAGEATQDINFELVPGAKITGHIRGADGRPVASGVVALALIENGRPYSDIIIAGLTIQVSDHQGNYIIDKIPPGRYAVYAGMGTETGMMPSAGGKRVIMYPQTFYPGVAEIKDATIIEVQAGSVTEGIDITFPQPSITNELTVRVVDEITGFPVTNCKGVLSYAFGALEERLSGNYAISDFKTDDKGQFNIANALLGHYTFHLRCNETTSSYGQDDSFDIVDPNVGGLEIKMRRAGSVSGVIVIDGENADKSKLAKLKIAAIRDTDGRDLTEVQLLVAQVTGFQSTSATTGPDGQFKLAGLSPGKQQIFISDPYSVAPPDFTVLRIEQ